MAKEIVVKIKIDGQEVDIAKKSMKELTTQIGELKSKLETVPLGSAEFKKIQGDINNLEAGFRKAKDATLPLMQSFQQLPGILGYVGKSVEGVREAFTLLLENPIVAVFAALAAIVLKVAEKMKNLEGVMDPLERIGNAINGVFDVLANTIMPAVSAVFEVVASGTEKLASVFGTLFGAAHDVGDSMKYVSETMDKLNDSNAEFELNQAKANRALQEAREIAGDATLSIGERVKALKDAEKIEREIAANARARELAKAHAQAVELANSLNYSQASIDAIKRYDAAQLESFLKEIDLKKGLNREKSNALYQSLAAIEESAAQEARIGKKTQTQIRSLEHEEAQKREEIAKKLAEQKKDYETRLATFMNDTRLQGIKDEQEKARVSLEIEKKKTLDEINTLELSNARKASLRDAAMKDYAAKSKALEEKQREENLKALNAFNDKVKDIEIAAIQDETDRSIAAREEKLSRDIEAMQKDTQFKKKTAEEQAKILKNLEIASTNDIQKIKDDAAKKNAELIYKQIEFERQSRIMALQTRLTQIDISNKAELDKIAERRKVMDEQAKIDFDKEIENLDKLHKAKEVNDTDYLQRKANLEEQYNTKIAENSFKTELAITEQRKKNNAAVMQLADSIGALGQAMGAETAAGKALIRVQQALALATTSLAIAQAFLGLGKDLAKGFPANLIAVASTLALIATAITQFKALTTPIGGTSTDTGTQAAAQGPKNGPRGYGDGGLISGPLHAQGGTLINAEGGEAVMTRGAVTMFGPLLSTLNQMGGGTSFNKTAMIAAYDSPKNSYPSDFIQSPAQIVKTYVVEGELTSAQQRQARLKDLSTI